VNDASDHRNTSIDSRAAVGDLIDDSVNRPRWRAQRSAAADRVGPGEHLDRGGDSWDQRELGRDQAA